jgi:TatA/E family protein of Tat protein translocase
MGNIGIPELLVIFVVALIVFGPRRLPELGKQLGKGLSEFKRASNELRNTLEEEIRMEERRTPVSPSIAAPSVPAPTPIEPSQPLPQPDAEPVARGQHGS